jgi:hypothetical protein
MKKLLFVAPLALLATSLCYSQSSPTATANLTVSVGAEAAIVVNSSPAFSQIGIFGNYTSTTALTYYVRTITSGAVTVQITTDFSTGGANGGPSVATPPTSGDLLQYSCTAIAPSAGLTTPCTSSLTASTAAATSVLIFGPNTQSAKIGNGATTSWILTNDPSYKAGSYTAVATYSISAV